jgi:hypothetical protein
MATSNAHSAAPEKTRTPVHLAANLNKQLLNYAAAASATGVSLLALSHSADARVIYTAANIPIPVNSGTIALDVNNDGIADFSFYNGQFSGADARRPLRGARPPLGGYDHYIVVIPNQAANEVGAITTFTKEVCAAELHKGQEISANKNFQPGELNLFAVAGDYTSPGTAMCQWQGKNNKGGFLALKFVVAGQTYFGWARISLGTVPTITGYAYENTPNGSLKTGQIGGADEKSDASHEPFVPGVQPASLGALARGASGLPIWRRPEEME